MGLRVPVWARQSSSHTASAQSGRSTYTRSSPSVRAEPVEALVEASRVAAGGTRCGR